MKKCNRCQIEKELKEFFKDKNHSSGHYSICKPCKQNSTAKWREENRKYYNAKMRKYQHENKLQMRLYRYGMTPTQFHELLRDQKGLCKICDKKPSTKRPLAVDHCHETGRIRGLLCYGCNRALHILDNKNLLSKAIAYLSIS